MALGQRSKFLYSFTVTEQNSAIDFVIASGGPTIFATLRFGFYSLTSLLTEIARSMTAADPDHIYFATADRTAGGGLENRVTIRTTNGVFLSLLFGSGPRSGTSIAATVGFTATDKTGFLTYTGTFTSGTSLVSIIRGYQFLSPDFNHMLYGSVNISASGKKETITYNLQQFWQVQFKYEPSTKVSLEWRPFFDWAIQQRALEFTPDITQGATFFEGTLEKTQADGKGLGYKMTEMIPNFPNLYDTGVMTFRVNL